MKHLKKNKNKNKQALMIKIKLSPKEKTYKRKSRRKQHEFYREIQVTPIDIEIKHSRKRTVKK